MNIRKYFEIAKKVAELRDKQRSLDPRAFLFGAVGVRGDGLIVSSPNGSVILDKNDRRGFFAKCHAEFRVCRKLDKNSVVFVVRIGVADGLYRNAKPCRTCQNTMRTHGVSRVYYSISENEYGTLILKK